jgi:hypothetical protein
MKMGTIPEEQNEKIELTLDALKKYDESIVIIDLYFSCAIVYAIKNNCYI